MAFQRDFEAAERGPRAIDPGKEFVDGGLTPEPITEAQQRAAKMLKDVYEALGADGSALMHDVLIHGQSYKQIAASRGFSGQRWERYFGTTVFLHLHTLAVRLRLREGADWQEAAGALCITCELVQNRLTVRPECVQTLSCADTVTAMQTISDLDRAPRQPELALAGFRVSEFARPQANRRATHLPCHGRLSAESSNLLSGARNPLTVEGCMGRAARVQPR